MKITQAYCFLTFLLHIKRHLCDEPFLEPKVLSEYEESFVLNDLEYIITDRRITWEEANIGCTAFEFSSLAIINKTEIAKFLALALSETNLVVEDLWVGSEAETCPEVCKEGDISGTKVHCTNGTCFKWFTGEYVIGEFMLPRFKEAPLAERNCLSFARNDHQLPSFVDLHCRLQRPYICQRPAEEEIGEMTHRGWIRIGNYEYAIFYAKKTWKESVRECFIKHNAHLADFRNMKEVTGIGKYLLTGRPSLENAWIGGHYKAKEWRYISIADIISNTRDPESSYPPWPDNNRNGTEGACLLLDRHLEVTKKLVFMPERCHRRKSYICSRQISGDDKSPHETFIIDDVCYTLFYTPKAWDAASQTCIQRKAFLVEVTEDKVDHVLYIMGENRTEINHIWIGGKLMADNTWLWTYSNETIDSKIFNGYPPWLDNMFDQKYACLNMDRENHNIAIFYGVYCYVKQPFVCQQYNIEECTKPDEKENNTSTSTVPTSTMPTPTTRSDPWKWRWPTEKSEYNRLKPYYVDPKNGTQVFN